MAMASASSLRIQVASPVPPQLQWNRRRPHIIPAALSPAAAAAAASSLLHTAPPPTPLAFLPVLLKSMAHATSSALQSLAASSSSAISSSNAAAVPFFLATKGGPLFFASMSTVSTPLTVVASGMAKWLELYSAVMMIRVLLSWFPNIPWEKQPFMAIRDMCDPYLNLFRNIIPPVFNALDLSPLLAFMVLGTMSSILNSAAQT
ncbi:hypothetical protein SELMODRAFT_438165 [Selaginella moellendorffii]|uniref:Uncharacterized protein n=1 Tax=Selaginella moellendorffii TaxID=88036 RepID=D8QUM9_SELML|nr:ylmG homolog protein 1-2, chloroplastic [Selaginella moellendorffii]EFJ36321.1 hypothetical protein SELMODRAFT_438165 [Selaginella moellendorffii]|eukprot:XP_002962858.1 ylmG homolog protein 1-2, chloroplastic [Selaginella moellendorffii]